MMDKKELKQAIGAALGSQGFVKKGQTWYRRGDDATSVMNVQKWDFGERYFLNVGIALKSLTSAEWPAENVCQIQSRATSLFPEKHEMLTRACSLDEANKEDLEELSRFLREELAPFCAACTDLKQLKVFFGEGRFERALVMKNARELLSRGAER